MLTRFENYLRNIKGYSERTTSEYLKDLKGFSRWLKANKEGARWSTLTREDIDKYISWRLKTAYSPRQQTANSPALALCIATSSARGF